MRLVAIILFAAFGGALIGHGLDPEDALQRGITSTIATIALFIAATWGAAIIDRLDRLIELKQRGPAR